MRVEDLVQVGVKSQLFEMGTETNEIIDSEYCPRKRCDRVRVVFSEIVVDKMDLEAQYFSAGESHEKLLSIGHDDLSALAPRVDEQVLLSNLARP
jgi:hypothetical protein